jgi:hypothetical protein
MKQSVIDESNGLIIKEFLNDTDDYDDARSVASIVIGVETCMDNEKLSDFSFYLSDCGETVGLEFKDKKEFVNKLTIIKQAIEKALEYVADREDL